MEKIKSFITDKWEYVSQFKTKKWKRIQRVKLPNGQWITNNNKQY